MADVELDRESVRNRVLRRVDWRFLLPVPTANKSICYADGDLNRGVAAISTSIVDPSAEPAADCDLGVVVDPDRNKLEQAWRALCPGGWLYAEWHWPWHGGLNRIRRQLDAAGYFDITCYWHTWSRTGSHLWLPLDVQGPTKYWLAHRPRAESAVTRSGISMLTATWQLGRSVGLAFPVCVMARKPISTSKPLPEGWKPMVRSHWNGWGLGPAPARLDWLLLTGGQRSTNKVTALAFADGATKPCVAVKLSRVPESIPSIQHEAATLQALHNLFPDAVQGAPRILFAQDHEDVALLGETALEGQPLYRQVNSKNFRTIALKATDWLIELAGHSEPRLRGEWWDRLVSPVLASFEACFRPAVEPKRLQQMCDALDRLQVLPLVVEQRDFSPWNVLVNASGDLAVLDWESAEPQGLPLLDLLYFLTYLAFFNDRAIRPGRDGESGSPALLKSFRRLHDRSTLTGRIMAECIARYTEALGLDPSAIRPLRLFVWLLHARSAYARLAADAGTRPDPAALRSTLFVQLWQEELRWQALESGD